MKILRIVLTGEEHPHYTITEAFSKHLTDTIYWDTLPLSGLNHEIQCRVRDNDYDFIFMQLQAPNIVTVETAKLMSERSTVFNWSGDVRLDLSWYIELAPYVITLFTNMTDVRTIQELGFRAEYLQTGYDHKYYFKKQQPRSRISFCANYYPHAQFPLTPYRVFAVKRLQQFPEFDLYGGNWEQIGIKSKGMLNNVQEAEAYNNSLLAINISHFNYSRYFSDRLLREMACGCCVLSHRFQDCEAEFEENLPFQEFGHIVYFDDVNDMEEKVKYFLAHPEEAIAIGENAAEYVKKYSWNNFVNNLIDIFKNNTK